LNYILLNHDSDYTVHIYDPVAHLTGGDNLSFPLGTDISHTLLLNDTSTFMYHFTTGGFVSEGQNPQTFSFLKF